MQANIHAAINSVRRLSPNQFALLVSAVGAMVIVGVVVLMLNQQPSTASSASTIKVAATVAVRDASASSEDPYGALKDVLMIQHGMIGPAVAPATQRQNGACDVHLECPPKER